jgi:hypothetical protein
MQKSCAEPLHGWQILKVIGRYKIENRQLKISLVKEIAQKMSKEVKCLTEE